MPNFLGCQISCDIGSPYVCMAANTRESECKDSSWDDPCILTTLVCMLFGTPSLLSFQFFVIVFYTFIIMMPLLNESILIVSLRRCLPFWVLH